MNGPWRYECVRLCLGCVRVAPCNTDESRLHRRCHNFDSNGYFVQCCGDDGYSEFADEPHSVAFQVCFHAASSMKNAVAFNVKRAIFLPCTHVAFVVCVPTPNRALQIPAFGNRAVPEITMKRDRRGLVLVASPYAISCHRSAAGTAVVAVCLAITAYVAGGFREKCL